MQLKQGKFLSPRSLIEKKLWWDTDFTDKIPLISKYRWWIVNLLWLEFWDTYTAKIEIFVPKSRMLRVYFTLEPVVSIQGFSFGTNTHRDQISWKEYYLDGIAMQEVLEEVIIAKFLDNKGNAPIVERAVEEVKTAYELYIEREADEAADRLSHRNCGLRFLSEISNVQKWEFYFVNVPIVENGARVWKNIKIVRYDRFTDFYLQWDSKDEWRQVHRIEPKQTYARLMWAVNNIIKDNSWNYI